MGAANASATSSSHPQFASFKWGVIEIDFNGRRHTFKDCVLTPTNATQWNWKLDGTRHSPGITVEAITGNDLLSGAEYVILSKGVHEKLQTKAETIEFLQSQKQQGSIKDFEILQSEQAVKRYTQLIDEGAKVSGLFHSTC